LAGAGEADGAGVIAGAAGVAASSAAAAPIAARLISRAAAAADRMGALVMAFLLVESLSFAQDARS
jgi:hypothetical protein